MTAVKDFIVLRLLSTNTCNTIVRPNENTVVDNKARPTLCAQGLLYFPFIICTFLICALLCTPVALANNNANSDDISSVSNAATIDFVKGYATVFPNSDNSVAVFAKRGMSIMEKDLIITGEDGFVSLSFKTGTEVNIQPLSEISLIEIDCPSNTDQCHVVLNAVSGNINSDVRHLQSNTVDFTITTPYASAAVRGTVFDIDISDGRLLTGVTQGRVSVDAVSGRIDLPENYGTKVEKDQPPSTLIPLLRAPMFTTGLTRFDGNAEIIWDSVALAAQYQISLENTTGIVYRARLPDTAHTLQPLDVGSYTARVRAIDQDGFQGQVADTAFDIVQTDTSKAGPTLIATVHTDRYSVNVQESTTTAALIELNFSPTKDFKHLLNLDVARDETVSGDRPENSIYVRARSILSNTVVTPYGPTTEVPAKK